MSRLTGLHAILAALESGGRTFDRIVLLRGRRDARVEAIVSLDPSEEGTWSPVNYSLAADTLTLSGPWTYHGEKLTFTVRLARVK